MIVRYFRDGGQGHTEHSVDYFFRASRRIWHEWSSARPLRVEINANGLAPVKNRAPYTVKVEFGHHNQQQRYAILLSGTQAGYGGTGPHGTASILSFLGVSESMIDETVFRREKAVLEWEKDNGWKWRGPFDVETKD